MVTYLLYCAIDLVIVWHYWGSVSIISRMFVQTDVDYYDLTGKKSINTEKSHQKFRRLADDRFLMVFGGCVIYFKLNHIIFLRTQLIIYRFRWNNWPNNKRQAILPLLTLQWRHNERDGVSNHQPHACLLHRLFRRRSKKTSKPRATWLCDRWIPRRKGQ